MKVEPELVSHPKYLVLRKRVGDLALEYLIRMWGHCAANKRGEFWLAAPPKVAADYLEAVCQWKKAPGILYAALIELRFIIQETNGLRIHDWNQTNWRAVKNWEIGNIPKGQGGASDRALEKPKLTQSLSQCISPLTELTELTEGGDTLPPQAPEVSVPDGAEVADWAKRAGVDFEWAETKRRKTDEDHGWERNGRLIDWRAKWKRWFEQDVRSGRFTAKKNSAPLRAASEEIPSRNVVPKPPGLAPLNFADARV